MSASIRSTLGDTWPRVGSATWLRLAPGRRARRRVRRAVGCSLRRDAGSWSASTRDEENETTRLRRPRFGSLGRGSRCRTGGVYDVGMHLRGLLIAVLLSACPVPPANGPAASQQATEPLAPRQPPAPPPLGVVDGQSCTTSGQCASGVCEGEGCGPDQPGFCVPAQRACTRDLRAYCGCDGATFNTSGSCPGRRYAHKEGC